MKKTNKLINWWLSKHGDIYLLHGNNATENGVEGISPFTLIESSRILNVEIIDEGFLFKTLNIDYFCEGKMGLDKQFDWLKEKELWNKPLNAVQVEICEKVIAGFQEKRIEADIKDVARKIMPKSHIELLLSDKSDDYLVFAKYVNDNADEFAMKKESVAQKIYLKYLSDTKDIYRKFEIVDKNVVDFGTNIWSTPMIVANVGEDAMRIDTIIGSFLIPEDGGAYLISPTVCRGRIPMYD